MGVVRPMISGIIYHIIIDFLHPSVGGGSPFTWLYYIVTILSFNIAFCVFPIVHNVRWKWNIQYNRMETRTSPIRHTATCIVFWVFRLSCYHTWEICKQYICFVKSNVEVYQTQLPNFGGQSCFTFRLEYLYYINMFRSITTFVGNLESS